MYSTIIKATNRAALRGKKLDDDCRRAIISKYEYASSINNIDIPIKMLIKKNGKWREVRE